MGLGTGSTMDWFRSIHCIPNYYWYLGILGSPMKKEKMALANLRLAVKAADNDIGDNRYSQALETLESILDENIKLQEAVKQAYGDLLEIADFPAPNEVNDCICHMAYMAQQAARKIAKMDLPK
jgi:hypothetical protein